MKPRLHRTLLTIAMAMAVTSLAHAQTASFTVVAGGPPIGFWPLLDLQGGGTLTFSESLTDVLDAAGVVTTAVVPATMSFDGVTLAISAPVLTLSGDLDMGANTFTATNVRTMGGAMLTKDMRNITAMPGSLSVTGITVDLTTKAIFADLTGANDVGTVNGMHVWNYADIQGPTTFSMLHSIVDAKNTITGLTITDAAFNVFAQSLGLTAGGKAAMQSIDDYGTLVTTFSARIVPEPSTYALMGLGLVDLALASKRARRA